ncbi:1,2-phenylacetyl-CoA epoxidase subunit PaaC [Thalassobacillus devorans]|uniref:1,2-phenylacetyl-CoA epoxidase subunit PaaC n=1 Tax=Thalassobacillus devorans TaxID=279813 RepID=UPI00048F918B|nr:1,2-phenylacetyl-CoA epoxidase subunit PaaC [Thalassobacillus devorans]
MKSVQEAQADPKYKATLTELLYQLADDDFIIAFRGSEWLGLAPHIEEDVAFSSINQDTMGHAAIYYQLLEDLGEGDADALAHGREASQRKNAVLLEEVNGPGHYLKKPLYDWAFAVVRNYFYAQAKKIRIDSLKNSSYRPLADAAVKINMELYYHLLHWKTWFTQLATAKGEAPERMKHAVEKVSADMGGVLTLGPKGEEMAAFGLIEPEEVLTRRWHTEMEKVFESLPLSLPPVQSKHGNGREGVHTEDLNSALTTLGEVYRQNPVASW